MTRRSAIGIALGLGLALALGGIARAQVAPPPLGEGDVLDLVVPGQPSFSAAWPIGAGGRLVVPGLGSIEGITDLANARVRMRALIGESLGMPDTVFSLTVKSWRPVIVNGAVGRPGKVPFRPGLRLIEAVALAGGTMPTGGITQRIQISQETERLFQAESHLGRLLARQARLFAEYNNQPFNSVPPEVAEILGSKEARLIFSREAELARIRAKARKLAKSQYQAALRIGTEDITAQKSITDSLRRQLTLVRDHLKKLQPLFDNGSLSGARGLQLRRDFVDIEGRVGVAQANLAQSRSSQVVLNEEFDAQELKRRADLIGNLVDVRFQIRDAESSRDILHQTLAAAGKDASTRGPRPGDCQAVVLRPTPGAGPLTSAADALTPLQPGDYVQIGRMTRDCPDFLILAGNPT